MSYDKTYKNFDNVFGSNPEEILTNFFDKIDKTKPVLDIGAGQGRNSIFLAEKGFEVDAIDPSIVAVETLSEISQKRNLNINTYHADFESFTSVRKCYSAIMLFGLIQILSHKQINDLVNKINSLICDKGLIFITAFGVEDPGFKKYSKQWLIEKENSFKDNDGNYRTYLKKNEVLNLFPSYNVVYHKEEWGKEHHHGDGILEKHFMVVSALQK